MVISVTARVQEGPGRESAKPHQHAHGGELVQPAAGAGDALLHQETHSTA